MIVQFDLVYFRTLTTKELAEELNRFEMSDLRTLAQMVQPKLHKGQLSRLDVINALLDKIEHQRPAHKPADHKPAEQQGSLFDIESIPAKPRRNY